MAGIVSERELIGRFSRNLFATKNVIVGAGGDDAGCILLGNGARGAGRKGKGKNGAGGLGSAGNVLVATSDIMFESSHFPKNMPHFCRGEKIAAANLSDLAAMGATPLAALFDFGFTGREKEREVDELVDGINSLCKKFNCAYLGGDTKRANELTIAGVALGLCSKEGILRRNNARAGDIVAVTGALGIAACGLKSLLGGLNDRSEWAFLHPKPKVKEGMKLAKFARSASAMDITDGLFYSLGEIARASKVGMEVETDLVCKETDRFANDYKIDKNELLNGGEDYELLITLRPEAFEKARKEVKLIEIGRVTKERRIIVDGEEVKGEGYDAFKGKK